MPLLRDFSAMRNSRNDGNNNPRRRNLASNEIAKTGHDSFHMNGDSPYDQYGIGTDDDSDQKPRNNHKDSKKGGKGKGNGGKGKGGNIVSRPTQLPALPPKRPPAQRPTRPPSNSPPSNGNGSGSGSCRSPISMEFLQFSAIPPAIFVFPQDPNPQDLGTRYIFNSDLRDTETLDELVGSRANGVCTRTQSRIEDTSGVVLQFGGGQCSFTYIMFDGNREFTMEASGTVVDSLGGTLSIVGGTKDTIGAFGEITLVRSLVSNSTYYTASQVVV